MDSSMLAQVFAPGQGQITSAANGFIASLSALPSNTLVMLFILLGFFLYRRYVVTVNFFVIFFAFIIFYFATATVIDYVDIIYILLYSIFFTIISFLSSSVGYKINKIKSIQLTLSKANFLWKIVFLLIMYFSFFSFLRGLSILYYHSPFLRTMGTFYTSLLSYEMLIGIIIAVCGLIFVYKKASPPQEDYSNRKTDYIFLSIIVLIAIITLLLIKNITWIVYV